MLPLQFPYCSLDFKSQLCILLLVSRLGAPLTQAANIFKQGFSDKINP